MREYDYTVYVTVEIDVSASNQKEAEDIAWKQVEDYLPPFSSVVNTEVVSDDEDDYAEEDEEDE